MCKLIKRPPDNVPNFSSSVMNKMGTNFKSTNKGYLSDTVAATLSSASDTDLRNVVGNEILKIKDLNECKKKICEEKPDKASRSIADDNSASEIMNFKQNLQLSKSIAVAKKENPIVISDVEEARRENEFQLHKEKQMKLAMQMLNHTYEVILESAPEGVLLSDLYGMYGDSLTGKISISTKRRVRNCVDLLLSFKLVSITSPSRYIPGIMEPTYQHGKIKEEFDLLKIFKEMSIHMEQLMTQILDFSKSSKPHPNLVNICNKLKNPNMKTLSDYSQKKIQALVYLLESFQILHISEHGRCYPFPLELPTNTTFVLSDGLDDLQTELTSGILSKEESGNQNQWDSPNDCNSKATTGFFASFKDFFKT